MRFDLLLSSDALPDSQRWRLVSSLYDQIRSQIEGSAALLVTFGVCAVYTHWWGFSALAGATLTVTILRLLQRHCFIRARDAGRGSPEKWARGFIIGLCVMSSLWASAELSVSLMFHDVQLLLFVLLIQTSWLAGAGVRNAGSPLAILAQTLLTGGAAVLATMFGTGLLVRCLSLGCLMFIFTQIKIARFYGRQILTLMESEQRLAAANEQLLKLSGTDGLTGIANRRAFDERFALDWAFAVREGLNLSVVIADVDYFKLYNDHYGHLAGDDCLRAVASQVAGAALRASDLPARYGGEEFVLLLPSTGDRGAAEVAERLRGAVNDANMPHGASPIGRVTISVGVASIAPGLGDLPATLMMLADEALYKAKQGGRNRMCLAQPALLVGGQADICKV